MPELAVVIGTRHRVIIAVREQILVGKRKRGCRQRAAGIGIDKSSRIRIVVSRLEVIEPRLGIVIVAPVPEGIVGCVAVLSGRVVAGDGRIAPGIVAVGKGLDSAVVIDGDDVALQVLLKPEGYTLVGR